MRTHGPRMNRARTREVIDNLGIDVVKSDGHGIEVKRFIKGCGVDGCKIGSEHWRLYTGGGIAGNSDQVWLVPITPNIGDKRGPFWNKTQLEKALRAWRRGQ